MLLWWSTVLFKFETSHCQWQRDLYRQPPTSGTKGFKSEGYLTIGFSRLRPPETVFAGKKRDDRRTKTSHCIIYGMFWVSLAFMSVRLRKAACLPCYDVVYAKPYRNEQTVRKKTGYNAGCNGRNRNFLSNVFGRNRAIPAVVVSLMRRDSERQRERKKIIRPSRARSDTLT